VGDKMGIISVLLLITLALYLFGDDGAQGISW
jgi:hypothetical protein